MKHLCLGICALLGGLAACTVGYADYSDSSSVSGSLTNANSYSSGIDVGVNELIIDIEFSVNINHTWIGDIQGTLDNGATSINFMVTDNGEPSNLGIDAGNNNLSPATYVFNDSAAETVLEAADGIGDDDELDPGVPYRPEQLLAAFAGQSTQGTWTLTLTDNAGGDDGFVNGWAISFTSSPIPEPGSLVVLGLMGTGLLARRRRS